MRILRKCGFAGRSAWNSHGLPLCSPFACPQDCANHPFPSSSSGTWRIFSESSTVAEVIRKSHTTGVWKFCNFAPISSSWLPPTPLVVSQPYGSIVESDSTALSVVPDSMSSSNRHVILQCFTLVFPSSCYLVAAFEVWVLEIFWKINLDQTAGVHKHNLASSWLMSLRPLWIFQRYSFSKLYWAVYRCIYTALQCARFTTRLNSEDISLFQDVLTQKIVTTGLYCNSSHII